MRKLKLLLGFLGILLLSGGVMYSCQSDGEDSYYFEEEGLTDIDLYVASETFQRISNELKKDRRRMKDSFSKFTPEDAVIFEKWNSVLIDSDDLIERQTAKEELSALLGFDYQERISNLFKKGEKFMKAYLFRRWKY